DAGSRSRQLLPGRLSRRAYLSRPAAAWISAGAQLRRFLAGMGQSHRHPRRNPRSPRALDPTGEPIMNAGIAYIHTSRARYVDELKHYLAIPSISALPQHAADVRRCAEWSVAELTRIGMQHAQLFETPGNPVVYADWLGAPGAPTILFYGHYDVQPV